MPKTILQTWKTKVNRRQFLKLSSAALLFSLALPPVRRARAAPPPIVPSPVHPGPLPAIIRNKLFWIVKIPDNPFNNINHRNRHAGVDRLCFCMDKHGLPFYRTIHNKGGLISRDDVVLLKVNAQWKYRGCTNSDVVRGLVQVILDHPEGFHGEVVIMDNGQGRGSLNCDDQVGFYPDNSVQANANNPRQTFMYLVNKVFKDPRVSAYLLDTIGGTPIEGFDHQVDGYRLLDNVSYPCFTTAGGRRVELREGIWNGNGYSNNLKLINIPVLKCHGGCNMTASLKNTYGVLSMADGQLLFRHFAGLGETCGKMMAMVRPPVLNVVDAIWVSLGHERGYPPEDTTRVNQLVASQDPVALDYWAAKYILYPLKQDPQHDPDDPSFGTWLDDAAQTINSLGGLHGPGVSLDHVTWTESLMQTFKMFPPLVGPKFPIDIQPSAD
jgi:uncharacterized protein (DUF362 family)